VATAVTRRRVTRDDTEARRNGQPSRDAGGRCTVRGMADAPAVKYDYLRETTFPHGFGSAAIKVHRALPGAPLTLCGRPREEFESVLEEAWNNAEPFAICPRCREAMNRI
jgi:hypothetical protein